MSASKSTYLHSFSAFPCNFPLSKGHFPDHMGPIWGQKPDTYCRIFKKLFSSWAKKKPGCCHAPRSYAVFMLPYLASAGLNVALTVFIGCVPAALG